MKLKDITVDNVKAYIVGNVRYFIFKHVDGLEEHLEEQFLYRANICIQKCYIENNKKCRDCGCDLPERWMVDKDGQNCPFPKIMHKDGWEIYKEIIGFNLEDVKKNIEKNIGKF